MDNFGVQEVRVDCSKGIGRGMRARGGVGSGEAYASKLGEVGRRWKRLCEVGGKETT